MHPTPLQKKIFWAAISTVSAYAIGYVLFLVGSLIVQAISFLQPVLIPVAIAAILGILLNAILPGNDYEFDQDVNQEGEGASLRV